MDKIHAGWRSIGALVFGLAVAGDALAREIFVGPAGHDANPGSREKPLATLAAAQKAARAARGREPVTITVGGGVYYLADTLVFTPEDSGAAGAPVVYQAAPGETVVLSGGARLALQWTPYRDGIMQAKTPDGLAIDQLFVNGQRQRMARYPNFDPGIRPYNGFAADAFSKERAARWADPTGGFIHAMHRAHWGGYHYRITGKDDKGEITYEGGWQNNRQMGMHPQHRYVENIFEELDAPGEWFHNAKTATLYYYPGLELRKELKEVRPDGTGVGEINPRPVRLAAAVVEIARLRHLIEFQGAPGQPVRHVALRGFVFRHAARTFMDVKEPLLRSDWTIYRGGAVLFNGAEDCVLADCEFDQLGGNAVFLNNYNRRVKIQGSHFHDAGASAIAFVGDPQTVRNPLFEYHQRQSYEQIDQTPGPRADNYPADCVVEDCLIEKVGMVEKQATGVQISMSRRITIRHCTICEASRAGINVSEGTFGGHVIEFCDVFDTVRETGDHGSFNSWGRDRFWGLKNAPAEELPRLALLDAVEPVVLRNNRWRCDHGWDVDLDDGSSNYQIYNNLFLRGGLKLREGFHRRVWNNIAVHNTLHPHVWYANSGDVVTNNIWMAAYRPAGGMPKGRWGAEIDRNLFPAEADRVKFAAHGCDAHSLAGDPLFVDPAKGDFRVKDGSPALKLGFVNFPMDQFGVQKPALKAVARTPEIPAVKPAGDSVGADQPPALVDALPRFWHGAGVRELTGEEFSAFGVSKESGGVYLTDAPAGSAAARDGFKTGDLLQTVNGRAVPDLAALWRAVNEAAGQPLTVGLVRDQQPRALPVTDYAYVVGESSASAGFKSVPLAGAGGGLRRVTTRPGVNNEPPSALHDGKLAASYGPVFGNGVTGGCYKAELAGTLRLTAVNTWSHSQNGNRGPQRFVLYGSASVEDPGWEVGDRTRFTPIAEVDTRAVPAGNYQASSIRSAGRHPLGVFRWLVWQVFPVTTRQENTAFQEFQVVWQAE